MLKMKKRMIAILLTFVLTISNSAIAWAAPEDGTQDSTVSEEVENSEGVEKNEIGTEEDETSALESEKQKDEISVTKEENDDAELNNIEPQTISAESKNSNGLFAGGTGTAEDPYQITTAEQMNNVRKNLSASYVLMNDIDLSDYSNWEPIGYTTTSVHGGSTYAFDGTFDGNGHSITGLTITSPYVYHYRGSRFGTAGLFGECSIESKLKNLKLKEASIKIIDLDNDYTALNVGVISASNIGEISDCDVESDINVTVDCYDLVIGGVIASCNVASNVTSNVTITIINTNTNENYSENFIGGITGGGGSIMCCASYGSINVSAENGSVSCGGICNGYSLLNNISKCVNYSEITVSALNAVTGGICGSSGIISNCFDLGNIDSSGTAFRICSDAEEYEITECYSLDSALINGTVVTDNIGADKPNGANLSEEEILKKIEALGFDFDEKEDDEETTTKKTIQGAIEHSYGSKTADTKVEELLSEYVDDWYSTYIGYTDAVEDVLMDSVEASTPTKKQAIKRRKEAMIKADRNPKNKEKYIVTGGGFPDEKTEEAVYEALSTFLYETICSEIDLSGISAEEKNEQKLIDAIFNSVKEASNSKTYKINGIKVSINTTGESGLSFGKITCNSGYYHTYVICSSMSQCQKAITNYMKELMGLNNSAIYQVYSAICKDVLGVSLDKLTEKYLTQNITKRVSKYASKFNESGIGNLATNLNSCYNYYQYTQKMLGIIDGKESPEKILKAMEAYGKFEDSSISDKAVKKAWKKLKKAATNLNEAYLSYLSGTDSKLGIWWDRIKPKWGKKDTKAKAIFSCPVNVVILNSSGKQIGYAGEDDVWFDSNIIYVEEKGDAKIIYSSSEEPISFNVSATAYGVLGCSIENYDEIGLPAGRTNYYDIELYPGKNITVSGIKNVTDGKVAYTVTSDGQTINANEYITSTQNAVVSIGCNVINNGTVDGTGSYVRGDAVVLTATPSDNSRFVGWMQGEHLLDTARIYEFTAKENTEITALFADISDTSEEEEEETEEPNGSGGSNNGAGSSNNNQADNNGTNNDNPVFTDVSVNNAPASTTSPQTGDENTLLILIITMLIASGVVAFNITSKKRKHI